MINIDLQDYKQKFFSPISIWFYEKIYLPLKYRFYYRYHIVKLKVPPAWLDADHRMFHAMFAVLGGYVEDDLGKAKTDDLIHKGYRYFTSTDIQAIDLWLWYLHDLPKIEYGDTVDDKRLEASMINYELAQVKLEELFSIRNKLWL